MPRLSPAIFGIWVMNGRQSNENDEDDHEALADHPVVPGDADALEQAVQALAARWPAVRQRGPAASTMIDRQRSSGR